MCNSSESKQTFHRTSRLSFFPTDHAESYKTFIGFRCFMLQHQASSLPTVPGRSSKPEIFRNTNNPLRWCYTHTHTHIYRRYQRSNSVKLSLGIAWICRIESRDRTCCLWPGISVWSNRGWIWKTVRVSELLSEVPGVVEVQIFEQGEE